MTPFGVAYQEPPSEPVEVEAPEEPTEEEPPDDELLSELLELEQLLQEPVIVPGPVVYSASRREEPTTAAPATVDVVTRREILERGYSQLIDVLRDLPGMETIEYYFSEFGTQVPVRGISGNNKIVVLVNGMRVNPPGGENFPFRRDFSVRHAERIEIIYGSTSTLYGQDSISAIINVVTLRPGVETNEQVQRENNHSAAPNYTGEYSWEVGAEGGINFEREVWGFYAGVLDCCRDIKLSGYVQYHDSDLTPIDGEFPDYWQDYRQVALTKTNANGKGVEPDRRDYGLNVFSRLDWSNSALQVWYRSSERSSAEGFNSGLGFLPEARWGDWSFVMEGSNTHELCDNVKLESRLTYNHYEIDRNSRYVFPASPTEWFLDDFKWGRGWTVALDETLDVQATERLSFLIGMLIRYSDIIPKATFLGGFDRTQDPLAQGSFFFYSETLGGPLQSIPQVSQVKYWTYFPYFEGQLKLSERLSLVGGVSVTWDDHFEDIPITPRASAIYSATDQLTVKYIYTQGFVQPAPYFAFAPFDNGTLLATVNPDVSAERAETHEVNVTYLGDGYSLGLAAYHGTQSDLITVADEAAPINILADPVFLNDDPTEPRTLVQTANGGTSERYGFELYGKSQWDVFRPWFSYSYVDFRQTTSGITTGLRGISKHNGRLGITWQPTCRHFITPSLVIRSTPENVVRGRLGREIQDPYEINLYALYRHSEVLDVFLDLRNITDHHYALGGFTGEAIPQETFHGVAGVRIAY
jgi:outer membrane receptor protein involved in Fe transport